MKLCRPGLDSGFAERMKIAVPQTAPVFEFDPELDGAIDGTQKLFFIQFEQGVKRLDQGNDRLAHADRADFVRFNQGDVDGPAETLGQPGCRHPAGSTAAHDDDAPNPAHRPRRIFLEMLFIWYIGTLTCSACYAAANEFYARSFHRADRVRPVAPRVCGQANCSSALNM